MTTLTSRFFLPLMISVCCACMRPGSEGWTDIEGTWISTPETSFHFPEGTLFTVLHFQENAAKSLDVFAGFMWEGHYYSAWQIDSLDYRRDSGTLFLRDGDGNRFRALFDPDLQRINGFILPADTTEENPEDTVTFVRADPFVARRFFFPVWPEESAPRERTYAYSMPKSEGDILRTASMPDLIDDTLSFYSLMEDIIAQKYGRMESLVIMKDGALVLEEYFYGYARDTLHNIHSCTKSIASLLLGIVGSEHPELGTGSPVFSFFPEYDSLAEGKKQFMKVEHLITMTSGLSEGDSPGPDPENPDQLEQILSLPLESDPGSRFSYSNENAVLLGAILQRVEGEQVDQIAAEKLFGPMEITSYRWSFEGDLVQCQSDLYMRPLDMAKIGQLVLNEGNWNGRQLVPVDWIRTSTAIHLPETEFFDYGYFWWHRSQANSPWWEIPPGGRVPEHDMVLALGYAGQYIMIVRDLDLVVVTTASDYTSGPVARSKVPMVINRVVPLFSNNSQ